MSTFSGSASIGNAVCFHAPLQVLSMIAVSSVADERGGPQFATLIPWPSSIL